MSAFPSRKSDWTADDLKLALEGLGWTGSDLAKEVGKSQQAASLWTSGSRPVPYWVEAYVALSTRYRRLKAALEAGI